MHDAVPVRISCICALQKRVQVWLELQDMRLGGGWDTRHSLFIDGIAFVRRSIAGLIAVIVVLHWN